MLRQGHAYWRLLALPTKIEEGSKPKKMTQDKSKFEEFLRQKGVDDQAFQAAIPKLFARYKQDFEASGAHMLELGKKFFWNDLRKEFPIIINQLRED
jgi:hypothetical protein